MKPTTCLTTVAAMLCVAAPLAAAPQNDPATPPPARPVEVRWQAGQDASEARRASEQSQAAAADVQALQNTIAEYQRAASLAADQGTAGRSDRPLIIRYSETDPKSFAAMNEDMNIMGRILDKAVRQNLEDRQREAMGIRLATVPLADGARNVEIEGYGAVFQLGVNFPLIGPAEKTEEVVDKDPTNSAWDETRRELYGPRGGGRGGRRGGPLAAAQVFDANRVESLKNSILDALKNASNMRNLKPDESVTVVVTSSSSGGWTITRLANPAATFGGGSVGGVSGQASTFGGGFRGGGGAPVAVARLQVDGSIATVTNATVMTNDRTGSLIVRSGPDSNPTVKVYANPGSPGANQVTADKVLIGGNFTDIGLRGGSGAGAESVLTIRAKKSDIDAFAKGHLNLDEFRSRASMQIY